MRRIVGIDLGTTNSCVAVVEDAGPKLIPNSTGRLLTPSVVRFLATGEIVVGDASARGRAADPHNTIISVKRLIGRRFNEIMDLIPGIPYQLAVGEKNLTVVQCHGELHTPQYISACILKRLRDDVEQYFGEPVNEAVICVPAYFTTLQREATRQSAEIAGWQARRIITEPVAAALLYQMKSSITRPETIAVCDLGGGTFDVSILEIGDGVAEVVSISGDNYLGGDDFDERIIEWIRSECLLRFGQLPADKPDVWERLRGAAIEAKHLISATPTAEIQIPFLELADGGSGHLEMELPSELFNELCAELFDRLREPCEMALRDAGERKIDTVLLVGGASRMTQVGAIAQNAFRANRIRSIHPDEAVALGAAVQAGVLSGAVRDILLLDATWASLGVETAAGTNLRLVDRNTTIPTRRSDIFSTVQDNQTSVEIRILEGEHAMANDNRTIARLVVEGLPPLPREVPRVRLTLDIDANQTLRVEAVELGTGLTSAINVRAETGLSQEAVAFLARTLRSDR